MEWRVLIPAAFWLEPDSRKPMSKPCRVAPDTTARDRDTQTHIHTLIAHLATFPPGQTG